MKPLRLLIADNYSSALEVYAEVFERAGYKVTKAGSYDQAQSALENMYFHVAVLDLRLRRNNDRMAVKSLGIRRDLVINWVAVDRTSLVQSLLPQEPGPSYLDDRVDEMEDLIGQLFSKAGSVNLERILWQKAARAALLVSAVFAGGITKFSVLVLGLRDAVSNEATQFQALGLDSSWPSVPLLERYQSSARFAGNILVFSGLNLQESRPLADLFRSASEKTLPMPCSICLLRFCRAGIVPLWLVPKT